MKKESRKIAELFSRYILILLVAIPNMWLFYLIFTPMTIFVSFLFFDIFFEVLLSGNRFLFQNGLIIDIISSCVAGAAYYLLFALNLSVPSKTIEEKIRMILFAFSLLFLLNVLRIFFLGVLLYYEFPSFDALHKTFWYLLSTIFVVAIWFLEVYLFKIKEIPVYSDLNFLYSLTKKR